MRARNRGNTPLSLAFQAAFSYLTVLLDDTYTAALSLTNYPDEKLFNILLYKSEYFSDKTNQSILKPAIKFLNSSERFDEPLFL